MAEMPAILLPVFILVLWSHLILVWMAAVRLPAISKMGLGPEAGERTRELGDKLEKHVQWKADNYNHLMEHPTVFYATALALAIAGLGTGLNLTLAWAYVGLRVVHSLVHCTINVVMVRFSIFLASTICVIIMAVNGVMAAL